MAMTNGVSVTRDHSAAILKAIAKLGKRDVLVGIPESTSSRPGEPINNAEVMYLNDTGSPANNIPARPSLRPGIEQSKELIAKTLSVGADAALSGDAKAGEEALAKAGQIGSNSVKRFIGDAANFAPNAPSTIRAKGSDHPLINLSEMLRAVSWIVRDK